MAVFLILFSFRSVSIPEWEKYSNEIMESSQKKIQTARLFQEHVKVLLKEIINDLKKQYFIVNESFQRRICELKEAKARLEEQHFEVTT